jgi:hypothetical protein
MWMSCHTQEEIAVAVGITQQAVDKITDTFTTSILENQSCKTAASHLTDFEPPIYNIWKQQSKTPGPKHFGNKDAHGQQNYFTLEEVLCPKKKRLN